MRRSPPGGLRGKVRQSWNKRGREREREERESQREKEQPVKDQGEKGIERRKGTNKRQNL